MREVNGRRGRRGLGGALLASVLALSLSAPAWAGPPPGLEAKLREVVQEDGAPGVIAMVFRDGRLLYRLQEGDIDPDAPTPIASASKWMTATLVMTVVDEGKLSLDEPIGRVLPELQGEAAKITLRQLMSFTSGQGSLAEMTDLKQDVRIPLERGALEIGARPLADPPGAVFKYGSGSMQLAGLMVERATGKPWTQLFNERIAGPLGLTRTYWGNPLQPGADPASVRNPNLQAGVFTTADDYARFLRMIAQRGQVDRRQILSPKAFAAMESVQTLKTPRVFMPPGMASDAQYAIGHWCESLDAEGGCVMVSSPGAFGVYPWVDRTSGTYGLFFLKHRLAAVAGDLREARAIILAAEGR